MGRKKKRSEASLEREAVRRTLSPGVSRTSGSPYVAVIGGLNADLQGHCSAPYRAGDSNPGKVSLSAGGVGRNIAENLVRLGCRVDFVSVLGGDSLSAWLRDGCERAGLNMDKCVVLPDASASQYLCLLDSDGSLVGAVAAMDGMDALTPSVLEDRVRALDEVELIVADANLPADSLEWIAERFQDKPLLLDPVSAAKAVKAKSCAGRYSLIKPNRAEAEVLTGIACGTREGTIRASSELRRIGVERVFLSLGEGGLLYDGPDGRGIVHAPKTHLVNVSGAGDAAAAALAWSYIRGRDSRASAALAVSASAMTVSAADTVCSFIDTVSLERFSEGVHFEELV